jgi:uncharacterized protein YigA (DUF484 family)
MNPEEQLRTDEDLVTEFLKSNPSWLASQADLLNRLNLHDQSNGTISLADRQLQLLREENKLLKKDLSDFLGNARENETLLHNTFELCLQLLCSKDLTSLFNELETQSKARFGVSNIRLCLFDSAYGEDFYQAIDDVKKALGDHFPEIQAITGRLRAAGRSYLFGDNNQVSSVALIPLKTDKHLGLLAFGSEDEHHFAPEKGDLFLQLFAKTLSLWLAQQG